MLNIDEYGQRIWDSNSHGELSHTQDYIDIAEWCLEEPKHITIRVGFFTPFFKAQVENAEKRWQRPASVYQHIKPMMFEYLLKDYEQESAEQASGTVGSRPEG